MANANTSTPQCTVDSDCTGVVTPTSACEKPSCASGTCTLVASGATTCDDGNACTYTDKCSGTTCAGTAITCTDSTTDPCHHLTCNGTATCASSPLSGGTCDDHDSCTKNDTCASGTCAGTAYSCTTDACATDTCDGLGGCVSTPRDAAVCTKEKDAGEPHQDASHPSDAHAEDAAEPHDAHVVHDAHASSADSMTGAADGSTTSDKVGGCACDVGARSTGGWFAGGVSLVLALLLSFRRRRARA
ncbi:MAG TPA: hypothetical protein VH853_11945 [Polyangia bacterium]|nr:hypothetical protein [Polyangia bacterium]